MHKHLSFMAAALLANACVGPGSTSTGNTGGSGGSTDTTSTGSSTRSSTSTTSSSSSSSSTGGLASCAEVDNGVGCCDASGAVHYCASNSSTPVTTACTGGKVCGWSASQGYYDCVAPPGGTDPSGQYPLSCSAVGSSSGGSSSGGTGSSSSGGAAVTWTEIYTNVFGPTGTSSCVAGGGCHTQTINGFKCGTSKTSCYNGFVAAGLVTPGSSASSSRLVSPTMSPLCSFGGNMPQIGQCPTQSEISSIEAWLAVGAPND